MIKKNVAMLVLHNSGEGVDQWNLLGKEDTHRSKQ